MTLRSTIRVLLLLVIGLPIVQAVFAWVGSLLTAMRDEAAAGVLRHVNTGVGIAWAVCLVGLVVTLALKSQDDPPSS